MKAYFNWSIVALIFCSINSFAQQIADTNFNPQIDNPEYKLAEGPVIYIDEGHNNFHTKDARFSPFAKLMERDGYVVAAYSGVFEKSKLAKGKILVVSNAINKKNVGKWYVPVYSAFTKNEIEIIKSWVDEGGSLFLIADHMPFAGAAKELAAAFGFEFTDGFAMDTLLSGPALFSMEDNSLRENSITRGRDSTESVVQVATFTGQGFKIPNDAEPILVFHNNYINLLPDTAWAFSKDTKKYNLEGWSQGAYKKSGKGRIVVFGEAAMFTAQLSGKQKNKVGMNSAIAEENYKLLLNIIHWLDYKFE